VVAILFFVIPAKAGTHSHFKPEYFFKMLFVSGQRHTICSVLLTFEILTFRRDFWHTVIASEAKQSQWNEKRLLRRFAPRNDSSFGCGYAALWSRRQNTIPSPSRRSEVRKKNITKTLRAQRLQPNYI
jgi:hypothetical protein